MMGQRQIDQAALFYEFSLERHVPVSHLLRSIDRFVDLSDIRRHLEPFYSCIGRPSIDPAARADAVSWLLLRHPLRTTLVRGSALIGRFFQHNRRKAVVEHVRPD
jgi:hypothetical protein